MKRWNWSIIIYFLFLCLCAALGRLDAQAQTARRIIFFTTLPTTCNLTTGDVAVLTSGVPTGLYYCSAANTWTPVGSTGGAGTLIFGTTTTFSADYTAVTRTTPGIMGVKAATAVTLHQYTGLQNGANTIGLQFSALKTRATDTTADTIVLDADDIAEFTGYAADGVDFQSAAQVLIEVDGTPGAGDMPGRIVFSTTADGAAALTERFRITQAGVLTNLAAAPDADITAVGTPRALLSGSRSRGDARHGQIDNAPGLTGDWADLGPDFDQFAHVDRLGDARANRVHVGKAHALHDFAVGAARMLRDPGDDRLRAARQARQFCVIGLAGMRVDSHRR